MKAKFLSLNARDFLKGLVVAVVAAVLTFLTNELTAGSTIDLKLLKRIGVTALIAFLSYLTKNLFTNSKGEMLTPEK
jgi:molybdopterin-binding protein